MNTYTTKADGTPRAKRPTKEECEKRKKILRERFVEGESKENFITYCKTAWNLEESAARRLFRKAAEDACSVTAADRTLLKGKIINGLAFLYNKALEDGDYRLALAVQKELCDISGLKKEENTTLQRVIYLDKKDLRLVQ